ncbi:uncharacterized protein LOC129900004 [Solanum dulcamara]|uniref:uncharacterized protein LOC129900004 n=1 Tax=Solanum dulcamara TaxID=45834 RepID=UPI0024865C68|nr:uncharacterized protein LOC129900004 [Solanum dulcamara]
MATNSSTAHSTGRIEIDHNHLLYLQPNDTPGSSLISLQLTGSENYALWSRSMALGLIGKSKLGFVDGRHNKDKFDESLHDQWEKVNAVERFNIVNGSRVFYLHREIVTLTQGTLSVSDYFSRMRNLWDEFDAIMPCPGCSCPESRNYSQHHGYQRLLQFLMGLNETYAQCRSQILMMSPIPTLNKAYSMIIDHESQRSLASSSSVSQVAESLEGAAFFSHKGGSSSGFRGTIGKGVVMGSRNTYGGGNMSSGSSPSGGNSSSGGNYPNRMSSTSNFRPQKKSSLVCEYCSYNGHTKENYYKLIGYPPDWPRSKKKGIGQYANQAASFGDHEPNMSHFNNYDNSAQFNQSSSNASTYQPQLPPYFTQEQYQQILMMLSKGNEEQTSSPAANAGIMTALNTNTVNTSWIAESGATNHMTSDLKLLHSYHELPKSEKNTVHLPTGSVVPVSHKGSSKVLTNHLIFDDLYTCMVKGIGTGGSGTIHSEGKFLLRTDNGCEFFRTEFQSLISTLGILHQSSCVYTPQQNGVVERKHRTILGIARSLRFQAAIPLRFWGECVTTAVVFGCLSYASTTRSADKFAPRAIPGVLMGYSMTQKGYKIYDIHSQSFFTNRNVIFKESIFPFLHVKSPGSPLFPVLNLPVIPISPPHTTPAATPIQGESSPPTSSFPNPSPLISSSPPPPINH